MPLFFSFLYLYPKWWISWFSPLFYCSLKFLPLGITNKTRGHFLALYRFPSRERTFCSAPLTPRLLNLSEETAKFLRATLLLKKWGEVSNSLILDVLECFILYSSPGLLRKMGYHWFLSARRAKLLCFVTPFSKSPFTCYFTCSLSRNDQTLSKFSLHLTSHYNSPIIFLVSSHRKE